MISTKPPRDDTLRIITASIDGALKVWDVSQCVRRADAMLNAANHAPRFQEARPRNSSFVRGISNLSPPVCSNFNFLFCLWCDLILIMNLNHH
jgi:hypothetical protein